MTYALFTAGIVIAFCFGFLLGDRRGVMQANIILDQNNKLLLEAMHDAVRAPVDGEDEQWATLH
ncbi:hypothetical protein [Mesorhizobium sp. CN2-181]|uniref:hypothetical protein n=1 Tax=Mesorhizobium yinganensis TaxID=3157707 RepID=UPI0032B84FF6